ncbi:MAG TPA: LysE family translocator [Devosia sp.]|nr:LysE family translocator [Devosia sp.]
MPHFIPQLPVIAAFGLATLVLAITPGPDMALFISRTINHGRIHGLMSVAGAISGLFLHSLLAAFGISLLLATAPAAFLALKITGALYLLWLALRALRAGESLSLGQGRKKPPSLLKTYLTGLGINLTNPKIILFFLTFLPQFVSASDPDASAKLLFLSAEFILISVPVVCVIVLLAHSIAAVLINSARARKILNWSFAAVFATFAATILALESRR